MEEKKNIFAFLTEVMVIFGISLLVLNVFCLIFGQSAQSLSTMFALGDQGVPVATAFQFLILAFLIATLRMVFFTDVLFQTMSLRLRTVLLLTSIILLISGFIVLFRWFPYTLWQAWFLFFLCFVIFFLGSWLLMHIKEKTENKQLEEALSRLKETKEQES